MNTLLTFQPIGNNKMKKLTIATLVATTLLSTNVLAESKMNPWKECGIGAMIFDDNGTAAAISNIIWDLGTTAVSSKISSEDSCNGMNVAAAKFIQNNYNVVIEETSQGSGEHLSTMLNILEVDKADHAKAIASIRSEMASKVVAKKSTPENYYNVVMSSI